MYPDHMPRPLISEPENLVTMLALEPVHFVVCLVFLELLLCLEAPPAAPHAAEMGTSEVHLPMSSEGLVMDSLISTN